MALADVRGSGAQEVVAEAVTRVGIANAQRLSCGDAIGKIVALSTLKTVYSRIIGIRRVEELSSAPSSRTCSCFTKYTFVPCSPLRTLPPNSKACLNVRKRDVRYLAACAIHNRTTLHPE